MNSMYENLSLLRRLAVLTACWLLLSPTTFAHPMGNFSISHYTGIHIEQGFIELHYLIDMAEIPTFQEMQQNDFVAQADDPRVRAYLLRRAQVFRNGLLLTLNGRPLPLELSSQDILFTQGAGNLPTMKFGLVYRAMVGDACGAARCELEYNDANFPGRVGWKEVIASPGAWVSMESSSAPSHDRSGQLANYPTDLIQSPPQDVTAKVVYEAAVTPPTAANSIATSASVASPLAAASRQVQLKPNQQTTSRNSFTELMTTKQFSLGIVLLAAILAAGLGALHGLEPGHGKTIVAAYLIGSKGTARHALLLGMVVTIAHTAGVYLLGAVTLYAQKYILPDRIYPFLSVLSGILIAGMGCYLFLKLYVGADFTHSHEIRSAARVSQEESQERRSTISARQLLVLGMTGGIVPCPAALVVMLSAVALHRTGFGLFLIVAFSIGLAAVLIAMGLAAVYAGRMMSRLPIDGPLVQRWLPMGSAMTITVLGCVIAVRGLIAAGLVQIRMWS